MKKHLYHYIKSVKDFPKKGIIFRDITPLLADDKMFNFVIRLFAHTLRDERIKKVVAIES